MGAGSRLTVAKTFAAYVYDTVTGLVSRCVVSDDYQTPEALMAAHCARGESAVVVPYDGSLAQNKVELRIATLDDEGMQAVVTQVTKIEPPPLVKYALVGPTGKVFDIVQTRRTDDIRLRKHAAFEVAKAIDPVALAAAKVVYAEYPDPEKVAPELRTKEITDSAALMSAAITFGVEPDTKTEFEPETDIAVKVRDAVDTTSGFKVFAADAKPGDVIDDAGVVRKLAIEPVVVEPDKPAVKDIVL